MEIKWLMIGWAVIMTALAIGGALEKYTEAQCKQSYTQSTKSVDEIIKICKG